MVLKLHGNVRDEVRVNFLALFASKLHIFMYGALKLSGIVRASVRLKNAIPMAPDIKLLGGISQENSREIPWPWAPKQSERKKFVLKFYDVIRRKYSELAPEIFPHFPKNA